tara:strand:+ start:1185 stop:1367 length:183 start_codon:yes stop_codon:yes gene_type:complete
MEEKKDVFISYFDDDDLKKDVWCEIVEETSQFITFVYNDETITIPYHRILKIKRKGGDYK